MVLRTGLQRADPRAGAAGITSLLGLTGFWALFHNETIS